MAESPEVEQPKERSALERESKGGETSEKMSLTPEEEIELERLLRKRGCSTCGKQVIGPHLCPGPNLPPSVWESTKDNILDSMSNVGTHRRMSLLQHSDDDEGCP